MMEKLEIKNVSSGNVDYRLLKPLQPEHYKKLGNRGFDRMWKALSEKGFRVPFQVWKNENENVIYILDGHQRRTFINALKEKGIPLSINGEETYDVPVVFIYADSKKDAAEMLLSIDSQYGDRDIEGMLDFLDEYEIGHDWVEDTFQFKEFDDFIEERDKKLLKAKEDEYCIPNEINTDIKEGDFFEIGKHRLICGDSTKAETFERLFHSGVFAKCVVTDPPYNVDYKGKGSGLSIINDKMSNEAFSLFLNNFYMELNKHVEPGGAWYVWHADSKGAEFRTSLIGTGILFKQVLIWVKNQFTLGRQDYQWQHEPCIHGINEDDFENELSTYDPCLYGWKEGASHN